MTKVPCLQQGLELHDLSGLFQLKPFCGSLIVILGGISVYLMIVTEEGFPALEVMWLRKI